MSNIKSEAHNKEPMLMDAHIRIARPTDNIAVLLPFYRDGLGFEVIGSFAVTATCIISKSAK